MARQSYLCGWRAVFSWLFLAGGGDSVHTCEFTHSYCTGYQCAGWWGQTLENLETRKLLMWHYHVGITSLTSGKNAWENHVEKCVQKICEKNVWKTCGSYSHVEGTLPWGSYWHVGRATKVKFFTRWYLQNRLTHADHFSKSQVVIISEK